MDEQDNKPTDENPNEGDKRGTFEAVERAEQAAKRMEQASEQMEAQNDRAEKLAVRTALGGDSEAGVEEPQKTEEEKEVDKTVNEIGAATGSDWEKKE